MTGVQTCALPISAEQGDIGQVLLGFLFGEEGEGVCQLEEVELIDEEVPTDSDSPHTR